MLQFPLYAGIMGMMKYSGLTDVFTQFFIDISTTETFPLFTMISAGIVNFFVPSGGGQWAVQGPVIVEAAQNLGVPVSKAVMALAYGDQLTNMIQPFWALPLLAITGLKAGDILKYSFRIMIAGLLLFAVFLVL
jgi:short-chain fatty acids transporter